MRRREFLATSSALAIGLGFGPGLAPFASAQDSAPVKGGTLIWGHSETTQNMDIHQTGTASTGRVLQNIHESIVRPDENLQVVPNLCESYEVSDDGLAYTFRLRDGVTFHTGAAMTSADVKYSFERCRNPATGAVNFEVFNNVDVIETPDPLTVVVRMSKPNAPFLARLAENGAGVVIPEGSGDVQGETPTGAGPFRFVSREFGNEVVLERFEGYFGEPAWVDRVVAREVPEPTVRLTGLRTGEFHMINDIPADRIASIESDPNLQVRTWFPLNFDFMNFNHKVAPFDDPRVRRAFDMMVDKETLLQGALWGQGATTATPSFPTSPGRNADIAQRAQDIEGARALLEEAGHPPGSLNVVFKVTTNYPYHVESAQILAEWFRMAGVNIEIVQLTWADWLSQVWVDKDFQMTMMNFFTLWEPDRLYYSLWHTTGGFNYRGISDPELDAMLEEARVTTDADRRQALYQMVQTKISDDALDVILWFRNGSLGAQPKVGGLDRIVHPNGSNLQFRHVWLRA